MPKYTTVAAILINTAVWNLWFWLIPGVIISIIALIAFDEAQRLMNRATQKAEKITAYLGLLVRAIFMAIALFASIWQVIAVAVLPASPIGIVTAGLGALCIGLPIQKWIKQTRHN